MHWRTHLKILLTLFLAVVLLGCKCNCRLIENVLNAYCKHTVNESLWTISISQSENQFLTEKNLITFLQEAKSVDVSRRRQFGCAGYLRVVCACSHTRVRMRIRIAAATSFFQRGASSSVVVVSLCSFSAQVVSWIPCVFNYEETQG